MKKAQRRDEDRGSHFSPKTKVCVKTVPLRRKSVRLIFSQRQGRQADDSVAVWIAELFLTTSRLHSILFNKLFQQMQSLYCTHINLALWSTQHKHSTTYFKITQKVKRQEQSIVCPLPTLCIKTRGCIFNNYHLYFNFIYLKAPRQQYKQK